MKRIIAALSLTLLALTTSVHAQEWGFNIKGGLTMNSYTGTNSGLKTKTKAGLKLGIGANYHFNDMFSLRTGLSIVGRGAKVTAQFTEYKINQIYFEIPALASADFAITGTNTLSVFIGPYFAYGIGGKIKSGNHESRVFKDNGYDRADMGLKIGEEFDFNRFLVGIDTDFGLVKLSNSYWSGRNISVSLLVGYRF